MRDPTSMRFLHSVITLYQWPLPLSRTSYAHRINWIRSPLNIRDPPMLPYPVACAMDTRGLRRYLALAP